MVLSVCAAVDVGTKTFDLPTDSAAVNLRRFADQSGLEVVFATATTARIRTNAVKGDYAPRDAMDRLLAGTGLIAEQNPRTGALTVLRDPKSPRPPRAQLDERQAYAASLARERAAGTGANDASAVSAPDETVQLSAFQVKSARDYGYRAANSITATGIGTEIYQTPISISVVTRELIDDLGADVVLQALQYTASVATDSRDPTNNTTRGFVAPILVNRVGGAVGRNPNGDFVERIEVVKGPNAVFFGRVAPGGVINLITLQTKSRDETLTQVSAGSYGMKAANLDINKVVSKNLEVRVAGAWFDRSNGFIDYTFRKSLSAYGIVNWRITPNLTVKYNVNYYDGLENVLHSAPRSNPDYVRNGTSAQTAAQYIAARYGSSAPVYTVYAFEIASNRGRHFNNNGPDAFKDFRGQNQQLEFLAQATSWLTLRLDGNYSFGADELLEITGFPAIGGTYVGQRAAHNGARPRSDTVEAEAVATFDAGITHHRLLAGARGSRNRNRQFSNSQSIPTNYNYFVDGPRHLKVGHFTSLVPLPSDFRNTEGEERAIYAVDQIGLWEDRLKVLGGVRKTWVKSKALNGVGSDLEAHSVTPQIGAVVEPMKGLSVFANYAKTFEPQFQVDVFGKLAPNVAGKGKEAGFKADLVDRQLSGTFSLYEVLRAGEVRRDPIAEIATGRSPIFIGGGSNRSRGAELELTWTPLRNYQSIMSYSYMWEAETIKDTNALYIGARLFDSPEHQFALWNRYTFADGAFKGLFIGAGFRYRSRTRPVVLPPSFDLWDPSYFVVDTVIGYERHLFGRPVRAQVNVRNLTNREYMDGAYTPANPLTAYLSLESRF